MAADVIESNLGILGHFFTDSSKGDKNWSMKCKLPKTVSVNNFFRCERLHNTDLSAI